MGVIGHVCLYLGLLLLWPVFGKTIAIEKIFALGENVVRVFVLAFSSPAFHSVGHGDDDDDGFLFLLESSRPFWRLFARMDIVVVVMYGYLFIILTIVVVVVESFPKLFIFGRERGTLKVGVRGWLETIAIRFSDAVYFSMCVCVIV